MVSETLAHPGSTKLLSTEASAVLAIVAQLFSRHRRRLREFQGLKADGTPHSWQWSEQLVAVVRDTFDGE